MTKSKQEKPQCGARHWKLDLACSLEPHAMGDHVHRASKTEWPFQKSR